MARLHDSGMLHNASDSLQIEMELEFALPGWYPGEPVFHLGRRQKHPYLIPSRKGVASQYLLFVNYILISLFHYVCY